MGSRLAGASAFADASNRALPKIEIDAGALAPRHRSDLVHDLLNITWELTGVPERPEDLIWRSDVWMLGQIMIGDRQISPVHKQRLAPRARADGIDHYQILLSRTGLITGDADGVDIVVQPGGLLLLDLARPWRLSCTPSSHVTFVMARDALTSLLPAGGMPNGLVLQGAPAALLTQYLTALVESLPYLTVAQAPHLEQATYNMLGACLAPCGAGAGDRLERARPQIAARARGTIQRAVDARLHDPLLSPEAIASVAGLSRSALYRLMQPEGGVAAFVLARRMARARRMLATLEPSMRIADVAAACGFQCEAQFSHSFRRETGITPSEARRQGARLLTRASEDAADGNPATQIRDWLFGMAG